MGETEQLVLYWFLGICCWYFCAGAATHIIDNTSTFFSNDPDPYGSKIICWALSPIVFPVAVLLIAVMLLVYIISCGLLDGLDLNTKFRKK